MDAPFWAELVVQRFRRRRGSWGDRQDAEPTGALMLTMRSQEGSPTEDPAGADQALIMGEAVALAFENGGGKLSGMSRDALASDLAGILEPLLSTCTTAEWIEAVNARLNRLEGETGDPGPRLERFTPDGSAEMTTPVQ